MKRAMAMCVCMCVRSALAQPGIAEMQQAKQQLTASFFSAFGLALVLSTLLGLVGALKIYHNWQMGKPRIDNDVAAWFFAAIFITLSGALLQAMFGI